MHSTGRNPHTLAIYFVVKVDYSMHDCTQLLPSAHLKILEAQRSEKSEFIHALTPTRDSNGQLTPGSNIDE